MAINEQEGPMAGLLPAKYYKTCHGCKWYDHRMVKSGRNPEYISVCKHESAPRTHFGCSNLDKDFETNMVQPGDWCQFECINVNPNP